mgnify:CR=1 FL=1
MKKIIHFVLSDSFAGIEQHVDELLTYSNKEEILICNNSIANYFNKKINIKIIKNFGRNSLFGKYRLKKLLKEINPDIVHSHGSKTTSIINSIKRDYKHIATVHGVKKNKKIFEKSDLTIGVSEQVISGINNQTEIITNWWQPQLKKTVKKNNKYALSVGRLEQIKGFDLLISSWKNIKTNLVIIGSGKEKKSLEKLIKKNNLINKINIIEEVSRKELIKYYENASVLVIPSRDEGGPRVALEALYLEIPVLSTNVGHMNKIFSKEFLAIKNDQKSLTDLLEQYVDNIHMLNQQAIFNFVEEEFSIERKIEELNKVYERLFSN